MDKKKIKQERMKNYFIEATMRLVREDGVETLTVKKIANLAGYASGTLYNYFVNLNELLFHCALAFMDECIDDILKSQDVSEVAEERMIELVRRYANYYIENPNVYRLLFLKDFGTPPEEYGGEEYIPELVKVIKSLIEGYAHGSGMSEEEKEHFMSLMGNSIHGNLLLFIQRGDEVKKEEVLSKIVSEAEYLLRIVGKVYSL